MNLHGIASAAIGVVNPFRTADLWVSTGYTIADDGSQVPTYKIYPSVQVQLQEQNNAELRQDQSLNIQGDTKNVYLNGQWSGILRPERKGGDLLVIDGQKWLVTTASEIWPDWSKLVVTLQNP